MSSDALTNLLLGLKNKAPAPAPTPAPAPVASIVSVGPAPVYSPVAAPAPKPAPAPAPQAVAPAPALSTGIINSLLTDAQRKDIQGSYNRLASSGDEASLQKYLATTPYTAAQLAAVTGYGVSDMQAALDRARAAQPNAQQWAPAVTQSTLGGTAKHIFGGDPGVTDGAAAIAKNQYEAAKLVGFRGTYEQWAQQQAANKEQAIKEVAANPNVVVGPNTPESQLDAVKNAPLPPASLGAVTGGGSGLIGGSGSSSTITGGTAPTATEMTPGMSVEERAAKIAATDSPLMQQARGRAMQQMNERGLINSSLGVQAGQDAVLDRAIDVAKADAQTDFQNAQNNANRNLNWQTAQLQAETSMKNAQLSSQTQLSVAEINRQYSQMANLSSTSASMLTAFNNDINSIVLADLPAEAKEAAINARTQTLRLSMNVMGAINGDVDMNNLLNQILG